MENLVPSEKMSAEAHAALWFALASLPEKHPRWSVPGMPKRERAVALYDEGLRHVAASGMSRADWRAALQKGLVELAEAKLVVLKTDGHGGYEVADVDPAGIAASSIVMGRFN